MSLDMAFNFVLASTINASIAGAFVFLTKKLASRILPHKFKVLLWLIFIVKLFFPFGPESKLSVFNSKYISTGNNIQEIFLENINASVSTQTKTLSILPVLWLIGFIITSLCFLLSNITLSLKLKKYSKPNDERITNIFTDCKRKLKINRKIMLVNQSAVKGTSLFGLLYPKILITDRMKHLTDRQIEYIFYHELSHYKRKDILTNYLIALIQAIHWFNPIIHIFAKVIRQDMELAADEKTISLIGSRENKAYGLVLISMLEEYSKFPAGALLNASDTKNYLKKRIRQILSYKKQPKCSIFLFLVLAIVLSFTTLTTAVPFKSTDIPKINIKIVKKTEQKKAQTAVPQIEESGKEISHPTKAPEIEKTQNNTQSPDITKKESDVLDETIPPEESLFPEAMANALLPGTDFDMMLKSILSAGRNQEYSYNVTLNSSCAVREFNIKEEDMVSLGNYTPDYNGNISLYIKSSSSQRLNIMLLKDGKALINASVKPSKTNSYSFVNLDKNSNYELILTCKGNSQYAEFDVSGEILVF